MFNPFKSFLRRNEVKVEITGDVSAKAELAEICAWVICEDTLVDFVAVVKRDGQYADIQYTVIDETTGHCKLVNNSTHIDNLIPVGMSI